MVAAQPQGRFVGPVRANSGVVVCAGRMAAVAEGGGSSCWALFGARWIRGRDVEDKDVTAAVLRFRIMK